MRFVCQPSGPLVERPLRAAVAVRGVLVLALDRGQCAGGNVPAVRRVDEDDTGRGTGRVGDSKEVNKPECGEGKSRHMGKGRIAGDTGAEVATLAKGDMGAGSRAGLAPLALLTPGELKGKGLPLPCFALVWNPV